MRVGIVGLGYVGLPLAVGFASAGVDVLGVDIDQRTVDAIASGRSHVEDISDAALDAVRGRIEVTGHHAALAACEAILICVPTPLTANREPDLEPLLGCAEVLGGVVAAGQLVVLESTTYPGTTRERVAPLLEAGGLRAGVDFNLAYSPERIDPGRTDYTLANTPKVVGGLTEECGDRAEQLYRLVCDEVVRVATPEVAELSKLLENIFRAVNIALVNELALLTDRMGIDIWQVVEAAATKPYGFMRFEPGPGMGGHCLPVDPFYLAWRAREFDTSTEFIELAGKVNQQMPHHCVAKLQRTLNDRGRAVRGSRIALLGVSYKPGVADTRESPALKIIDLLGELGAEVVFHDPYVAELPGRSIRGVALEEAVDDADLVLVVTAHRGIDYDAIAARGVCVLDLRGVVDPAAGDVVRL
jgi:UDP-N-acetyl-D-glucosamine dehydrogenase